MGTTAAVTVKYATANGTAQAGSDYTATSGVLTFPAGQLARTVGVAVRGERVKEGHETFFVNRPGWQSVQYSTGKAKMTGRPPRIEGLSA